MMLVHPLLMREVEAGAVGCAPIGTGVGKRPGAS